MVAGSFGDLGSIAKEGDVKTEYSNDTVPLHEALIQVILKHRDRWFTTP